MMARKRESGACRPCLSGAGGVLGASRRARRMAARYDGSIRPGLRVGNWRELGLRNRRRARGTGACAAELNGNPLGLIAYPPERRRGIGESHVFERGLFGAIGPGDGRKMRCGASNKNSWPQRARRPQGRSRERDLAQWRGGGKIKEPIWGTRP